MLGIRSFVNARPLEICEKEHVVRLFCLFKSSVKVPFFVMANHFAFCHTFMMETFPNRRTVSQSVCCSYLDSFGHQPVGGWLADTHSARVV